MVSLGKGEGVWNLYYFLNFCDLDPIFSTNAYYNFKG